MVPEKPVFQCLSLFVFQNKEISAGAVDDPAQGRDRRVGKPGQDHGLMPMVIRILFMLAGAEPFQDKLLSFCVFCQITDAVPPSSKPGKDVVSGRIMTKPHYRLGVPHSGQNFALGGSGLPQF